MKFPTAAVFAVLAAIAEAKVQFTNSNYDITEGDPFTLKWSGAEGPVTITVKSGPETNLKDVMVIDCKLSMPLSRPTRDAPGELSCSDLLT